MKFENMVNSIFCMNNIELMSNIPDNSVDIIVTSPPYWNQKEYSFWPTYYDYLESVRDWVKEIHRILDNGRHVFWVIPDKLPFPPSENGGKERLYLPIYSDTENIALNCGFVPEFPIIWKKPHGTQKMFGSYPYPPTVIHTPMTERICVWRKKNKYRKRDKDIKERSKFTKEDWVDYAQDLWEINPETRLEHPAPFPEELVRRVLLLWSFKSDIVFDPFLGSGTTAVVARSMDRNYIGVDYKKEYIKLAESRLAQIRLF